MPPSIKLLIKEGKRNPGIDRLLPHLHQLTLSSYLNIHFQSFFPRICKKQLKQLDFNQSSIFTLHLNHQTTMKPSLQKTKHQPSKASPFKFNVGDYKSHSLKYLQLKTPQPNMENPKETLSTQQEPQTPNNSSPLSLNCMKSQKATKHKKTRPITKKAIQRRNFNSSLWTLTENTAYTAFLSQNLGLFNMTKIERRDSKINVLMSKAIHTRSADQCRSHHQKMIKYHGDIPNIIAHVAALKQNQGENQQRPMDAEEEARLEPILLDFFEQEEMLENFSFCEQLMNGEWNYL